MEKTKKKRGDRKDGTWIRDVDPFHIIMPYLYINRTDNEAFISERIDLTSINAYLEKKNEGLDHDRYNFFHVLLAAAVKTVTLRPKMNRFIQGYRMYQRNELSLAFVVKKQFNDDSHEAMAFERFSEDDTIDTIHEKLVSLIHDCRSDKLDDTTEVMDSLRKLPRPVLTFFMWLMRKLDFYGKVPYSLIKEDPNYASVFITNLGSIGLKSGYHHLSNWGTNSIFIIIGEKKMRPFYEADGTMEVRETIDLGLTLDERIVDGYYYSKTVKLLKHLLQNPELLELPAKEAVDYE